MRPGDQINLDTTVTAYFSALNPIARKIHQDIDRTRATYQDVWHALSHHEQGDLINESLIRPEIKLHYFNSLSASLSGTSTTLSAISNDDHNEDNDSLHKLLLAGGVEHDKITSADAAAKRSPANGFDGRNLRTFHAQRTGQKIVHDEMFGMFRDEHSAPFSVKTKSQLNLSLFPSQSSDRVDGGGPSAGVAVVVGSDTCPVKSKAMPQKYLVTGIGCGATVGERKDKDRPGVVTARSSAAADSIVAGSADSKTDFLRTFMCKDSLGGFNATNAATARAASTDERCGLIDATSTGGGSLMQQDSSSTSLQSDDDYEKAAYCGEESTRLLNSSGGGGGGGYELHKGFEFLSNW